jgi:hypothetical protein
MISPPAAAEGDDEPAAAATAAAPKRKRGADAEESADAADADEADGDNSASAAAAATPAAKKQKGAAAEPAAASASSSSAAAATTPAAAPALTSFAGKKFLVMGGFSAGKFKVESAISTHGGELTTSVLKSLDYCVYGAPVATDYGGVSGPGSKKYKEAKKLRRVAMIDEEEFFKLVAAMEAAKKAGGGGAGAAGAAGAGAGSSSGGAGGDSEAHPIVAEFREILALLGASDVKLEPATLSSITAAEDEMRMAIPPPLKALLLHVADGSQAIDSAKVGDLPYFWPSVADIREQFSYNSYLPIIYRDCKWMPYHMLDYGEWHRQRAAARGRGMSGWVDGRQARLASQNSRLPLLRSFPAVVCVLLFRARFLLERDRHSDGQHPAGRRRVQQQPRPGLHVRRAHLEFQALPRGAEGEEQTGG